MKVINVDQNTDEWLEFRRGKVGGSGLKDIITERGNSVKIGVFKLLADRLAVDEDVERWMNRGHEQEVFAIKAYEEITGIELSTEKKIWQSDDDPDMMVSPDACNKSYTHAVEVKCLKPENHLKACVDYRNSIAEKKLVLSTEVPNDYRHQILQYYIVNEKLKTVDLEFYNESVTSLPTHIIKTTREQFTKEIETYKQRELEVLNNVRFISEMLSF